MVDVRTATPADAEAIARINVRGWQASFRGIFPDEFLDALEPEDRLARIEEVVSTGAAHHGAVAVERDEVLGFVLMGPPKTEELDASRIHEIYSLYVEPSRIGTGVGRALMAHALDYLRSEGWEGAVLWTLRDAERTSRFYDAAGWSLDGAVKVDEIPKGNPVVQVRYRIDLH